MLWSLLLFTIFALLSGVGVCLIVTHHRGRTAGLVGGLLTMLFFAAVAAMVLALFREGGFL